MLPDERGLLLPDDARDDVDRDEERPDSRPREFFDPHVLMV